MVTVTEHESSAAYNLGSVWLAREYDVDGGHKERWYEGAIKSAHGIIHITCWENTRRGEQCWTFAIVDPDRYTTHERCEVRTRRDFLTPAGAKRVALK